MNKKMILVIEDDDDIRNLILYNLTKAGFNTTSADNGRIGLEKAFSQRPDLILLDLMLPEVDGITAFKQLRQNESTSNIPVIMVTAKGDDEHVVNGLRLGADDYISKPFSPKILIARIETVLRRSDDETTTVTKVGTITIDDPQHLVHAEGVEVTLTASEYKILRLLASRPGWVFSRGQIIDKVHGYDVAITDRAIDVQIVGLRRKLGSSGSHIKTLRGVGYKLLKES